MNLAEFLNTVPAFEGFTREEVDMLERAMVVADYEDGHVFAREGGDSGRMYLIVDGEVAVTRQRIRTRGVDEINRLRRGELFALVSLVDHAPHSATCTAVGPVRAAYLPRSAFDLLFRTHARVGRHFQWLIARQLVHDMRTYTGVLLKRMAERPA